jgi:hypothetical protein
LRNLFTVYNIYIYMYNFHWERKQFQHIHRMRHLASQLYTPGLDLICEVQTSISFLSLFSFSLTVTDTCPEFSLHIQHINASIPKHRVLYVYSVCVCVCVYDFRLLYSIEPVILYPSSAGLKA